MAARQPIPQIPRILLAGAAAEQRVEIPVKPIEFNPIYGGDNAILFPQKEKKRKIQSQTIPRFFFSNSAAIDFWVLNNWCIFLEKNHLLKSHVLTFLI